MAEMPDDTAKDGLAADEVAPPDKSHRNTMRYSRHGDDADMDDDDDDDDDSAADEPDVESEDDDDDM